MTRMEPIDKARAYQRVRQRLYAGGPETEDRRRFDHGDPGH
jgi:hypothetical protein